ARLDGSTRLPTSPSTKLRRSSPTEGRRSTTLVSRACGDHCIQRAAARCADLPCLGDLRANVQTSAGQALGVVHHLESGGAKCLQVVVADEATHRVRLPEILDLSAAP